ncbi:transcriptional regulator [Mycolicibacterium wolinskyi]|uniref:Transcriptional regulator n=1 Tax=Mycolicibacterium wolinskyi TaxID=59750 RepID=A0A132PS25_9MYCO|nr:TetR/AcrR family transcriptional regulator [Mycolicibacterium wolinskyi]KWX25105.1 transcriptional regulator [Mycolicibacterium wolinskyi]
MTEAGGLRPSRGPGRPVGADSAQTRATIKRAGCQIINERGYAALTFQEIAKRTGLSRPTLNYYFATRAALYDSLVEDAAGVVNRCIDQAGQHDAPLNRLGALVDALVDVWHRDPTMVAFLVSARLEAGRNPALPNASVSAVRGFLDDVVEHAIARDELPPHTQPGPIAELLHAILWGVGAWAGCGRVPNPRLITRQLDQVLGRGLLADAERGI